MLYAWGVEGKRGPFHFYGNFTSSCSMERNCEQQGVRMSKTQKHGANPWNLHPQNANDSSCGQNLLDFKFSIQTYPFEIVKRYVSKIHTAQ